MSRAVVDAKEFSHAMSKISKILKKCAIPILEEVCLRIQNGRCTLTATDLETWLTAEFPASGDDMFFAFRKTKDILRACSHFAGELTMDYSETQSGSKKAGRILLRCERRGAEFEVYDGADYLHPIRAVALKRLNCRAQNRTHGSLRGRGLPPPIRLFILRYCPVRVRCFEGGLHVQRIL